MAAISLEGTVALVTGSGRGLGRAHAVELARRGAAVVVNDVIGLGPGETPAADTVVVEIEAAGGRAAASHDSIATPVGGKAMVDLAVERFGRLDILVHNAGVWRNVPFAEMTPDQLDPVLDVHLRGAFFVAQPAWVVMQEQRYGRIVLTSSCAGAFGREHGANYAAAKAGLLGLSRALALEGADLGIKANAILPHSSGTDHWNDDPSLGEWRVRLNAALGAAGPRRQPERVSSLVAYLASRECAVSGEAFSALAGRYARVFIGLGRGWLDPRDEFTTAEEIAAHLDEIEDLDGFLVPAHIIDELRTVAEALGPTSREA
jgi:NAD(P)-dependent dehydrogenase (short-subunit alcohol dehydrogenase family)